MKISCATLSVLFLILGLLGGCRSYEQDPFPGNELAGSVPPKNPIYRIRTGDTVGLRFVYHSEWNEDVVVRSDGKISVALTGEIEARSMTIAELTSAIEDSLSKKLKDPEVTVNLRSMRIDQVYVAGETGSQGPIDMPEGPFTVLDAIVAAGGYQLESDLSSVILCRENVEGVRQSWIVNMEPILTAKTPPQPVYLLPGDVIIVPDTPITQVNNWIEQYINKMVPGGATSILTLFVLQR